MKIVIIGGVAGGASAAARARRLDENAEIVLVERGEDPSFANCGLPYYVGGQIPSRESLLVAPIERLRRRYRLDVRVRTEATSIQPADRTVTLLDLETGRESSETYDKLILATGAVPFRPPIPGIDGPRIAELRDLRDADRLHALATGDLARAVIVGAGFIGIEVAENLVHRGLDVTIVELADQILPPWDREMVGVLQAKLKERGIHLRLADSAERFDDTGTELVVHLKSGQQLTADFAVVSIGVRPENRLAVAAGIDCGARGGIITNAHMQTSDPHIYAVGDVAQVRDPVSGATTQIPLAGPANRQGRIAADHIFERNSTYRGTQGTAVVGIFDLTAAMTGYSEKLLIRNEIPFEKIYIHAGHHAGYYPGAQRLTIKLLFSPDDGRILGAQAVGAAGVDKRIDVIAMAMQAEMTVYDLEESELCYAPQYGSAKDPVNMAGFVAAGVLRGDQPVIHADSPDLAFNPRDEASAAKTPVATIIDVRTEAEFAAGHIPRAINIPLESLRERLGELPSNGSIVTYCEVGQRGYMATRILLQTGFDARNLSGGFTTWKSIHAE